MGYSGIVMREEGIVYAQGRSAKSGPRNRTPGPSDALEERLGYARAEHVLEARGLLLKPRDPSNQYRT
eukprot:2549038-Rhodomonas_salina.3